VCFSPQYWSKHHDYIDVRRCASPLRLCGKKIRAGCNKLPAFDLVSVALCYPE
jgi:hypothetical protein